MLNNQGASTSHGNQLQDQEEGEQIREIHALTPPHPPPTTANRGRQREPWETHSYQPSSLSMASNEAASSENFTSMSREFSALVLAGSSIDHHDSGPINGGHDLDGGNNGGNNLERIGEDDLVEETNPLAIVPDNNPLASARSPRRGGGIAGGSSSSAAMSGQNEVSVQRVKKEEVEAKISAWQNAKIAKVNNRFKREDAVINGWESEQVQKANSWMKKTEVLHDF